MLFPLILLAQDNKELERLLQLKELVSKEIILLQDSVKRIEAEIKSIEYENALSLISDSAITTMSKGRAIIRRTPSPMEKPLVVLDKPTKLILLDYSDGYFGVLADSTYGYISDMWIEQDERIKKFLEAKKAETERLSLIAEEKRRILALKEEEQKKIEYARLEQKYIKLYGRETWLKLRAGYYWIGMDREMAMISLGYPDDINRTVNSFGVYEQWVYSRKKLYLYFENGILNSYQD